MVYLLVHLLSLQWWHKVKRRRSKCNQLLKHWVATKIYDRLVERMKERDGITEELKALHKMEWVRQLKAIRIEAETVVMGELLYE